MSGTQQQTVLVDARSRVTLYGKAGCRYLLREEPGGVLVLEPAIVMSAVEARVLAAGGAGVLGAEPGHHPRPPRRTA